MRIKKPVTPEKVIENEILYWLWSQRIFAFKVPTAGYFDVKKQVFRKQVSPFAVNGISDVVGILPGGRMLCIEVKSKTGKVSKDQIVFIDKVNQFGGLAFVARSLDEVKKALLTEVVK